MAEWLRIASTQPASAEIHSFAPGKRIRPALCVDFTTFMVRRPMVRYLVENAGVDDCNGIYKGSGFFDGVPKYTMQSESSAFFSLSFAARFQMEQNGGISLWRMKKSQARTKMLITMLIVVHHRSPSRSMAHDAPRASRRAWRAT